MTAPSSPHTRVVVLGGGFGGVYVGMRLEKLLRRDSSVETTLVNKENYFTFQPMLAEIVSGDIGLLDTVSPLRRLLPRTRLCIREIESVDFERRVVSLRPGFWPRPLELPYDHLVIALGTVTDFREIPGLHEHALPFKTLADAVALRNHLIHVMDEAAMERDVEKRRELLTFVVAGGGFSGVEVAATLNDFVRGVARRYGWVSNDEIRVVLIHSGERILERELKPDLTLYAQRLLQKRGVELRLKSRLRTATPDAAVTADGERIVTRTLVSTVPSSPHPLIAGWPLPKERGRIKVNRFFEVDGVPNVWAVGDCATIVDPQTDIACPPTAQCATRAATLLADNLVARLRGAEPAPFRFKGLGKMGSLGHRSAVAELFNRFNISGYLAWFLWRTIYWWKLPGVDRKIRLGISWALDLLLPPETVQLKTAQSNAVSRLHYEPGDIVFRQGDLGDSLYIIVSGEAEVVLEGNSEGSENGPAERVIATLRAGEYFGEMALLSHGARRATVRCLRAMTALALQQRDFQALVANMPDMKQSFEEVMARRIEANANVVAHATPGDG